MHAEMARAFDGLGEVVDQEGGRREVVARVIGRWRTPAVVEAFEQWLEEVMERKRSSDLNERDLRIMGLESDMSVRSSEQERGGKAAAADGGGPGAEAGDGEECCDADAAQAANKGVGHIRGDDGGSKGSTGEDGQTCEAHGARGDGASV